MSATVPCPDCSLPDRPYFHADDSTCRYRRRQYEVVCRGASLWESMHNLHMTRNADAVCDACKAKNAAVVAQLKAQPK